MMPASLRELRRERWAGAAAPETGGVSRPSSAPEARSGLLAQLRTALAELLAPRRPAHD